MPDESLEEAVGNAQMDAGLFYPDADMLKRAVTNCRVRGYPRWRAVADMFVCGQRVAIGMCRRFGVKPDEVTR